MTQWLRCESPAEALAALRTPGAAPVAGATDLLVALRDGRIEPQLLVDLSPIEDWRHIEGDAAGLSIGALSTYRDLMDSAEVATWLPVLAEAASVVGTPPIRNRGTVGGSLANASAAADLAPLLVLLGARLVLVRDTKERTLELASFLLPEGGTELADDELIARILLPVPDDATFAYRKIGRRRSGAIARLNGAAMRRGDEVRLCLGAATPAPLDLSDVFRDATPADWTQMAKDASEEAVRRIVARAGRRASAQWKFPAVHGLIRSLLRTLEQGGEQGWNE